MQSHLKAAVSCAAAAFAMARPSLRVTSGNGERLVLATSAKRPSEGKELSSIASSWLHKAGLSDFEVRKTAVKALSNTVYGIAQVAAGGVSFVATLAISQALQGGLLRVAASTPLGIPNALGLATVAGASLLSLRCAEFACSALASGDLRSAAEHAYGRALDSSDAGVAAFGVLLYRCLGGEFRGIAPSAIDDLGAFSRPRASMAATLQYATGEERAAINALGGAYGCHTCGRRVGVRFNADHMPPLKYVKQANARLWRRVTGLTVTQRFYPQCAPCSGIQAQMVRGSTRFLKYHHVATPHRCYSTGLLLVAGVLCLREYVRERHAAAAKTASGKRR